MSITDRAQKVLAEVDAALALAEKATHGEWIPTPEGFRVWCEAGRKLICATAHNHNERTPYALANTTFIAASRTLLPASLQIIRDDIKAWLELRDSLQVGRDGVTTWDFCNRRLTAICEQWWAAK